MQFLQIGWAKHNFLWTLTTGWYERINESWERTKDVPTPVKDCLRENLDVGTKND